MRSNTQPVEGNVVRLTVEFDEDEVEEIVTDSVRTLTRQARVPGFRPGKVPRPVLEARFGGARALRAEAVREALPDLYQQAVVEANLEPIAPPEIDVTSSVEAGPLTFDAVVQVRPIVAIPGYQGLRVEIPAITVSDEEIDQQVDRMRDTDAELVEVGRPAADGDHVTIDLHGSGVGGEESGTDDYVYEVGSGRVVPELDETLHGARPGDVLTFTARPAGAGIDVAYRVLVKQVREKRLPALTDEWAEESSDFGTLEELRADLRTRIGKVKIVQAQFALQANALSALAQLVDEAEVPEVLVDEEVRRRLHDLEHRLADQRVTLPQFLAASGRTPEELLQELRTAGREDVKGDLALSALAEAEQIEVTDEDLDKGIARMAERVGAEPGQLRSRLEHDDKIAAVRSEQRKLKAMDWLLDHVELVDAEGQPVSRDDLRMDQGAAAEEETEVSSGTGDAE